MYNSITLVNMIIRNCDGKLIIINKKTFINDTLYYKQIYNIKYKMYENYLKKHEIIKDNKTHCSHTDWLVNKNISF